MRQPLWRSKVIRAGAALWTVALLSVACDRQVPTGPLVLNDFEGPADLERIRWRCRTTFTLAGERRSHGQSGLWMTLYPEPYPGLELLLTPAERRWRGYRYLALEVENPEDEELSLAYRIDDSDNPDYADRVNGSFRLAPGLNRLRLDLLQLQASGSKRALNLDRIDKFLLFLVAPPRPISLAVDHIRLEPDGTPR